METQGRYLALAKSILEHDLKLKINESKTHITNINEGVAFLGFIIKGRIIRIESKRIKGFKDIIRRRTPRNHGKNIEMMVKELNSIIRG